MNPEHLAQHTRAIIAQRVGEEIIRAAELEATISAMRSDNARLKAACEDLEAQSSKPAEEDA